MTRRWQSCSLSKRRKRQREPSDPHQKAAAQHRGACGVIDPTLTLDDVAKIIHKSRRWLREWLRDNPRDAYDRPLYVMAGRTMLFTDQHVKRILESLPCRSRSFLPATPGQRTSTSGARTSVSEWTRAAELTAIRRSSHPEADRRPDRAR